MYYNSPEMYCPILLDGLKEMKKQLDAIQITLQTCIANLQGNQMLLPSNGNSQGLLPNQKLRHCLLPYLLSPF